MLKDDASRPSGPLGILAGNGQLPLEVADAVQVGGRPVHIVGLEGDADPGIARHAHTWVSIGRIGAMLRAFRDAGCRDLVILGGVRRPDFRKIRLDLGFFLNLPVIFKLMRGGDDSVLRRVVGFFERSGFRVVGAHDVAPGLLAKSGLLGSFAPKPDVQRDIETGLAVIQALGSADVGQAVVIAGGRVVAVEAAEGTDAMLARLARLRGAGHGGAGGALVKAAKPGQEMRVDLPTIGPGTIASAAAAGLDGIAVAAGQVLLADRAALHTRADEAGLFLFGAEPGAEAAPSSGRAGDVMPVLLGGKSTPQDRSDAARALTVMQAMTRFGGTEAVVVARRHVLAVEAGESAADVIQRIGQLRQWSDSGSRRRRGVVALRAAGVIDAQQCVDQIAAAGLAGIVLSDVSAEQTQAVVRAAVQRGINVMTETAHAKADTDRPLRIYLIAGEHSGDALGARLIPALRARLGDGMVISGVGGEGMQAEGLKSLFPLSDVAVMGPLSILPKLPRIMKRVYRTVDDAIAADPDVVVIIDSPEFTHPIAKRIRKRRPDIPIVDYVSPSVWAWRSGRAAKMRRYVDHVLALLPFEPDAHQRLGGPPCTYVGHPLIERWDWLQALETKPLSDRLGLDPAKPVLLVLPGSRTSEVGRLMQPFGETVRLLLQRGVTPEVVIPVVPHVRPLIEAALASWPLRPHLIEADEDKFRAFKLARDTGGAALAASGTVTLELAMAGTPMAVGYQVDALAAQLRFLVKVKSVVLANLVLDDNAFPELLQEECTPDKLAAALAPLLADTPERGRQVDALARIPERMRLPSGTPSDKAADIVIRAATTRRG